MEGDPGVDRLFFSLRCRLDWIVLFRRAAGLVGVRDIYHAAIGWRDVRGRISGARESTAWQTAFQHRADGPILSRIHAAILSKNGYMRAQFQFVNFQSGNPYQSALSEIDFKPCRHAFDSAAS